MLETAGDTVGTATVVVPVAKTPVLVVEPALVVEADEFSNCKGYMVKSSMHAYQSTTILIDKNLYNCTVKMTQRLREIAK